MTLGCLHAQCLHHYFMSEPTSIRQYTRSVHTFTFDNMREYNIYINILISTLAHVLVAIVVGASNLHCLVCCMAASR
jgi:hypothetical protein